jgi:uncharacterized protein (TIGR02246 family)
MIGLSVAILPSLQSQAQPARQSLAMDQSRPGDPKTRPEKEHAEDEAAIRANVAQFVKAYNAGDAKAIASLFTPDGKAVDDDGNEAEGRQEIEQAFAKAFAASPKKQLEVDVESILFVGADLAVETGSTKETLVPGEPPINDRYTVIHVKRDGKWLMALARDDEGPPPTAHEQLKPLAWLVGEWVDDGGSSVVKSSCHWSDDGNFLVQEFKLQLNGENAMNVSQRIGWDPLAKHIRSWVFDSEGGFGESVWTRDGNNWIIKATSVEPDGTAASATNQLVPTGTDSYIWRSTDRIAGDERQAPIEAKVVRKPPQPKG